MEHQDNVRDRKDRPCFTLLHRLTFEFVHMLELSLMGWDFSCAAQQRSSKMLKKSVFIFILYATEKQIKNQVIFFSFFLFFFLGGGGGGILYKMTALYILRKICHSCLQAQIEQYKALKARCVDRPSGSLQGTAPWYVQQ